LRGKRKGRKEKKGKGHEFGPSRRGEKRIGKRKEGITLYSPPRSYYLKEKKETEKGRYDCGWRVENGGGERGGKKVAIRFSWLTGKRRVEKSEYGGRVRSGKRGRRKQGETLVLY